MKNYSGHSLKMRFILAILAAAVSLTFASCSSESSTADGNTANTAENTAEAVETADTVTESEDTEAAVSAAEEQVAETSEESAAEAETVEYQEKKPDGTIDSDAGSLTDVITISSAKELAKIGNDTSYPLDGDYVLVADIDMSDYGNLTPIGGAPSNSGIVEGKNVFSGTFDGRGHTIYGMSITVSSTERVHVGLFASLGSKDKNDPAVIKNLIIKSADINGNAKGVACYGVLAGQASGYVEIDDIALVSCNINVHNESGDILGVGALIGQCRTDTDTGYSNNGIKITNIFTDTYVVADNNGGSNYTSGVIGRIRASDLGKLSNVMQLGKIYHEGGEGNPIAGGDSKIKVSKYVYYIDGSNNRFGTKLTYTELMKGDETIDKEMWHRESGTYPILNILYESSLFSPLDFISVSLAAGETTDKVKSDFTLTQAVFGSEVSWTSDNSDVIAIDGTTAKVTKPELGYTDVTLKAAANGMTKTISLRVVSGVAGEITFDGEKFTAHNYGELSEYNWEIKNPATDRTLSTITTETNELTYDSKTMSNSLIVLTAEGYEDASYFISTIPTIYINSETDYYSVSKSGYSDASMTISTTEKYADTAYNGDIQIKLRGNSTAYQSKRPFHIKLETKTDLFGMGSSRQWVLLANYYDRTNLRNKLSYDFSSTLGMVSCESILVNVIYNGTYYGMYELSENIRIESGRVDIFDWEELAEDVADAIAEKNGLSDSERETLESGMKSNLTWVTSGTYKTYTISDYYDMTGISDNLNGGWLIEDDAYYDEVSKFTTSNDMKLMFKSPEYISTNSEMFNAAKTYLQSMEDAIYSATRVNSEGKHYSEYMDVGSFVDFWMVNEVFKNVELLFKSCYMYKDVDGLLTFGPIWDMDWAAGNHVNLGGNGGKYNTWWHSESQDREYWYRALYNDPHFIVLLYNRWYEIQDNIAGIITELDEQNEEVSAAAELDNDLWNYDWTNEKEVSTLRKWLNDRIGWMGEQFETPDTLIDSFGYYVTSKVIDITGIYDGTDFIELIVEINDDTHTKGDLLINGTIVREVDLVQGTNRIRIEKSEMNGAGEYSSLEIITKKADGSYTVAKKRGGQNGATQYDSDYWFYLAK